MIRRCDRCGARLFGRKGHGHVMQDGRALLCTCCAFPESCKKRKTKRGQG